MAVARTPLTACGPYVPISGGKVQGTLVVKAAPERSSKYGETVCTALLLDNGSMIRIYPVPWSTFWTGQFSKWVRVEATVVPSDERASRPESHKLQSALVKLDSPLVKKGKTPWEARKALVAKAVVAGGLRHLRDDQQQTKRSLGVVRVRELIDFRITAPLDKIVEQADYRISSQQTLTGETITEGSRIDKLTHVFRYRWRCDGPCCDDDAEGQGYHDTTCEDWEMFESFREWRKRYTVDAELLNALANRYYSEVGQSDLHFFLGTPSDPKTQNSWMIVGLFYPGIGRYDPKRATVCSQGPLAPETVLQPDAKLDDVEETSGKSAPRGRRKGRLDEFLE